MISVSGFEATVHQGIYRERVNPPRGGESDAKRIVIPDLPFENPDGSPVRIATDYFGASRPENPAPDPFEIYYHEGTEGTKGGAASPAARQVEEMSVF